MLNPSTSPLDEIRLREKLISLTPESDPYLDDAFFPIGLYDVPLDAIPEVAAAGFNLILNGDTTQPYLDRASAAGVRVIPYIRQDRIPQEVVDASNKEIFAWYLMDEPDLNEMPPSRYRELSRELRRQEKERPIFLTVWSPDRYYDFIDAADIFAPNPYPVRSTNSYRNNLQAVAMTVDAARAAAGRKPVWAILQAFWAEPLWDRNPTPDELHCMAFLALNHGATGIILFSYKSGDKPLTETPLWTAAKEINDRIAALRGALLVPPDRNAVGILEISEEPPQGAILARPPFRRIAIDAALRPYRGSWLLTIVNPDPWPKQAQMLLPDGFAESSATEIFPHSGAPEVLECSKPLNLSFTPFQSRIFWIAK